MSNETPISVITDENGNFVANNSGSNISNTTPGLLVSGKSDDSNAQFLQLVFDDAEEIYRLAISGKTQITAPQAPSGTVEVIIDAGTPLELTSSTYTTTYTITSGTVFHVQQIVAGAEGDPTERGTKIEVFFNDGTDHIVSRIYLDRESIFGLYPDTSKARDGTSLSGNGTNTLKVKRTILQGASSREVDAVIRGYEN